MGWAIPRTRLIGALNLMSNVLYSTQQASGKFDRLQRQVVIRHILDSLQGKRSDDRLLSYDEVRELLQTRGQIEKPQPQMIRLDQIVGSVGRYRDFDRAFLPLSGANSERWKRLDVALNRLEDVPPIEVFQISDAFFVRDGNHRVSVARANGLSHIEAWVTVVDTPVPLSPDIRPDELIIKAEYADFLRQTKLNEIRPDARIELTEPGRYRQLLEHIQVHHYYLGLEQQRDIPYSEAVASWYDHVYLPAIAHIRDSAILKEFPNRTEADLYMWITYHRDRLRERYGHEVDLRTALHDFANRHSERTLPRVIKTVTRTIRAALDAAAEPAQPPLPEPEPAAAAGSPLDAPPTEMEKATA